jgi:hypothetical protein
MQHAEEIAFDLDETGDDYAGELVVHTPAQNRSHTLYGLPQHVEGQSVHVGTPKVNLGTHPGWDYAQTIKDSARARQYEWLSAELRLNGRVHGTPRIIHLKPKVERIELSTPARESYAQPSLHPADARLDRLEALIVDRLYGGGRRPFGRPHRFAHRAQRLHGREKRGDDDAIKYLREQQERERQLLREQQEREREHQEELRARDRELFEERLKRVEQQAQPAQRVENPALDLNGLVAQIFTKRVQDGDEDTTDRLIDRMLGSREERAENGWADLLKTGLEAVKAVAQNPANVIQAAQALGIVKSAPAQTETQPTRAIQPAQHAPTTAPPERSQSPGSFEEESAATINRVLSDMKANAPVFTSARSVVWLFRTFPQETVQLRELLEQPTAMVQAAIAQTSREAAEIVNAPHAGEWIDKLKANVAKRMKRETTPTEGANIIDMAEARAAS